MPASKFSIVVLISGNGSNLQAIIDHTGPIDIRAVISNVPDAYGLQRATQANIATHTISHQQYASREAFEQTLQETIDAYQPQLIVLAGFMRRLSPEFVRHYSWKMINIHPSLLPKYPGMHTYHRALESKDSHHGVTIHFVTEEVDAGPIIYQVSFPISPQDNEETLKKRTQIIEHQIYPEVLRAFAEGRIQIQENKIYWDGKLTIPANLITLE